jgi:hypothetical protein
VDAVRCLHFAAQSIEGGRAEVSGGSEAWE